MTECLSLNITVGCDVHFFHLTHSFSLFNSMDDPRLNKHDIFKELTTYKNDYRKYGFVKKRSHKWPRERSEPPPKPLPSLKPIDIETFVPLREDSYIPFDLLWEKKPITGTNPADPFYIPVEHAAYYMYGRN